MIKIQKRFGVIRSPSSFASEAWKKSTLKFLIQRTHMICDKPYLLKYELDHLKTVFNKINNYPAGMVKRIMMLHLKLMTQHHNKQNNKWL